jgi:hypothetical protein
MFATLFRRDPDTAKLHEDIDQSRLEFVEGTLQRIDYSHRTLRLIAEGRVWQFTLGAGCLLFFDDERAILRCFHPLDHVHILFITVGQESLARSMSAWEKPPACGKRKSGCADTNHDGYALSEKSPNRAGDFRPTPYSTR